MRKAAGPGRGTGPQAKSSVKDAEEAILALPLETNSLHDRIGEMLRTIGAWMGYRTSTRQKITLQAEQDGHTSLLRAPAWDAHLPSIDAPVVERFEAN